MKTIDFDNFDYWDYKDAIKLFLMSKYDEYVDYLEGAELTEHVKCLRWKGVEIYVVIVSISIELRSKEIDDFIDQWDISVFLEHIETEEERLTFKYNTEEEGQPTN